MRQEAENEAMFDPAPRPQLGFLRDPGTIFRTLSFAYFLNPF
jgi:hypothetical protein